MIQLHDRSDRVGGGIRAKLSHFKHSHKELLIRIILGGCLIPFIVNTALSQNPPQFVPQDKKSLQTATDPNGHRDVRELKVGQWLEEQLKTGEVRRYSVRLKVGEYMRMALHRQTSGVSAQIFDPACKSLALWITGGKTPGEAFWVLAAASGDYEIKITAPNIKGDYGPFKVSLDKIGTWETAPSSDRLYLKAHTLLSAAAQFVERGDKESLAQAIPSFQQALELWRQLGERGEEAFTLHELAYAYQSLGETGKAIDLYSQAITLWRISNGYELEEANTLYNLGSIYAGAGKTTEAIECYRRVVELRRSLHNIGGLAYGLNNLGQVYINLGEFEAALNYHQEALRLRTDIGDVEGQARSLSNIGGVYYRLGEYQEALNYALQALPLRRAAGDRRGEAINVANIGTIYRILGEPVQALLYQQQALDLSRAAHDIPTECGILDSIGQTYYELGNYSKALDYHNQALARQNKGDLYAVANILAHIGKVHARTGRPEEALKYFEQALALNKDTGDRAGQAVTLENAGEVYRAGGELAKARDYFTQALDLSRAIKNRFYEANLLYDIAHVEQAEGRLADARTHAEGAIALIESSRGRVSSPDLRTSFLATKQDFYELEIDLLMASYKQDHNPQTVIRAFNLSEQKRARGLLDSLEKPRSIRNTVPTELLTRERDLRAKLNQKVESQIKLLSGKYTTDQAAALSKELDGVSAEYEQVLSEIAAADPHYAALTQSAVLGLPEVQKNVLDSGTLLLEYSLGPDRSYLWAVTSTDATAYELPGRSVIEEQAHKVYDLLTARNQLVEFEKPEERQARVAKADREFYEAAASLSRLILGPLEGNLTARRLLIVSDGALQYVPFAALILPTGVKSERYNVPFRPLVLDHEITSVPSASILGVLRQELKDRRRASKTVAVLADPVFSKKDQRVTATRITRRRSPRPDASPVTPSETSDSQILRAVIDVDGENGLDISRLPSTRDEARVILGLVPKGYGFAALDFDANHSTATNPKLGDYRIVHFATHGLLNTTHPGLSGLILSLVDRRGNDQNGFLTTNEIFNLNLPADLVVLSGCRTGLGKEIKGEGLQGLTRGFFYAGAARVAVSLWDVNDKSTADLMARFYRGMLGPRRLSPAAALREAQIQMWQSSAGHPPYSWAAFILQGEYN